jgi:hypothetical protein
MAGSAGSLLVSGSVVPFVPAGAGSVPTKGLALTYGTLTLNETTPVTVANAAVTASSSIIITLQTVGGTVGVFPHIATITPGTGFTIFGTAGDTSIYSYLIIG